MYRWFHPNLRNIDAERLLEEHGEDGSYLVRPSNSFPGHFTLSIKRRDERITHIKIRHQGKYYDLYDGEKFITLAELVRYYQENYLQTRDGTKLKLLRPLNSSDPTAERWFHGSMSGPEAERLLKERGVNGSFLVRESQSDIGHYVLAVRMKDETIPEDQVRQIKIRRYNNKYDLGGGMVFDSLTKLIDHYRNFLMVEANSYLPVPLKYPFYATTIIASDIDARIDELSKVNHKNKSGFWEEFENIQHQECKHLYPRKAGQEDGNVGKNRYRNILPYDHTRVKLKKPMLFNQMNELNRNNVIYRDILGNLDDSDYINANHISLLKDDTSISARNKTITHSKSYIATQGPLDHTINDFWWMVWQEKSECIVMLAREFERGKPKCQRYWPKIEQKKISFGPLEVTILSEETKKALENDYIYRRFELRYSGSDENNDCSSVRQVAHYQYLHWPDQHTPSRLESFLNFLEEINSCEPPIQKMIVHCSAGIGRTGALIVIDMLIDQLKQHKLNCVIDVQSTVEIVRSQRSGLVQTEAQYKFIYLVIQSYIASMKRLEMAV